MGEKIEVILVDVGNSSVKTTEVVNGEFQNTMVWLDPLPVLFNHYSDIPLMISSVRKLDPKILQEERITVLLCASEECV